MRLRRTILIPIFAFPLAALLALGACSGSAPEPEGSESESPEAEPSTASPSPSPEPLEAADGTDYDACYDADCEVLVTGPVDIPIDPELDIQITVFSVTQFDESALAFEWSGGNSQSMSSGAVAFVMSEDSSGGARHTTREGLHFETEGFDGEQMILVLSVPE